MQLQRLGSLIVKFKIFLVKYTRYYWWTVMSAVDISTSTAWQADDPMIPEGVNLQ